MTGDHRRPALEREFREATGVAFQRTTGAGDDDDHDGPFGPPLKRKGVERPINSDARDGDCDDHDASLPPLGDSRGTIPRAIPGGKRTPRRVERISTPSRQLPRRDGNGIVLPDMHKTAAGAVSDWMTAPEVCRALGIHRNTIYDWIEKGWGPPVYTFNGNYRYRRKEVDDWIAERRRA